ncbi:hypothetical protein HK102_004580 [Quaeritorhiza haematococci]|nr:hypothetical protein HK102_004580 [Quaeritorhiza haematococci]
MATTSASHPNCVAPALQELTTLVRDNSVGLQNATQHPPLRTEPFETLSTAGDDEEAIMFGFFGYNNLFASYLDAFFCAGE